MADKLEDLKKHVGNSETAYDVITASACAKHAATLGIPNPAAKKGDALPPGWHGCFFPATYGPQNMRADGQPAGAGIIPVVPLPRRRLGGTRSIYHDPLRIGDEVEQKSEIASIDIEEVGGEPTVRLIEIKTTSTPRGTAIVDERILTYIGEHTTLPPPVDPNPGKPAWTQSFTPDPATMFRFSACRFNTHRIHYDRDYCMKSEGMPGLSVQGTLLSQLMMEMCRRELPDRPVAEFGNRVLHAVFDRGPVSINGAPSADGKSAEFWVVDQDGEISTWGEAKFS